MDFENFINAMGLMLTCFYIFGKAIHCSPSARRQWIYILWCILCAFLYAVRLSKISPWIVHPILFGTSIFFVWQTTKTRLDMVISAFLLSYGISYSFLCIASLLIGFISAPILSAGYADDAIFEFYEPIYLLFGILIAALQFLFAYLLFKIKRFRNGFSFLFKSYAIIVALITAGIILVFASLLIIPRENYEQQYFFILLIVGIITVGGGIVIWVRRGIKIFYKRKQKEHSIELYEQVLAEKEKEIQQLTQQNDALRVAIHKFNHRLAALEQSTTALAKEAALNMEASDELAIAIEDINRLSKDFQNDVGLIKGKKSLPSTKIKMLDGLFIYFAKQCDDNEIDFNLKMNGSILYMVEHIVSQSKLETMIGDHLQNALIAVNMSDNPFRCILVILGLVEDCYELSIFDSGIPFEIDTLTRLGKERITTHADTGGNGIGFMTTFETIRECGASLVIYEKELNDSDFTKSITIRFDGKSQYIIETYRPDDFLNSNDGDRVISDANIIIKSYLPANDANSK